MFTLWRHLGFRRAVSAEAPALIGAMAIAESLYKFHSFTLECAAFLATWCVLSAAVAGVRALASCRQSAPAAVIGGSQP